MTSMTRRCRSVSPLLSALMPGGRPGSARVGRVGSAPSVADSFTACTGSNRPWGRSWAVMMALSAVVVTSAPLEWSPWLDNGSRFRKVAPNTRSSEKTLIDLRGHAFGCRSRGSRIGRRPDRARWNRHPLFGDPFSGPLADGYRKPSGPFRPPSASNSGPDSRSVSGSAGSIRGFPPRKAGRTRFAAGSRSLTAAVSPGVAGPRRARVPSGPVSHPAPRNSVTPRASRTLVTGSPSSLRVRARGTRAGPRGAVSGPPGEPPPPRPRPAIRWRAVPSRRLPVPWSHRPYAVRDQRGPGDTRSGEINEQTPDVVVGLGAQPTSCGPRCFKVGTIAYAWACSEGLRQVCRGCSVVP